MRASPLRQECLPLLLHVLQVHSLVVIVHRHCQHLEEGGGVGDGGQEEGMESGGGGGGRERQGARHRMHKTNKQTQRMSEVDDDAQK